MIGTLRVKGHFFYLFIYLFTIYLLQQHVIPALEFRLLKRQTGKFLGTLSLSSLGNSADSDQTTPKGAVHS